MGLETATGLFWNTGKNAEIGNTNLNLYSIREYLGGYEVLSMVRVRGGNKTMILRGIRNITSRFKKSELFIKDINSGYKNLPYRALLYYKTEPFTNQRALNSYNHTNLWEITEMVAIMNHFGFAVDVVDRSADNFSPENIYHLYIGLGSGNSGKHFAEYAQKLPDAIKILYATGTDPTKREGLGLQVYEMFHKRTGIYAAPMRIFDKADFNEFINYTDYIFCIGEKNVFSYMSYKKYGKPVLSITPGTSPDIQFSPAWLKSRKRNQFLCFAGNGFIHKGVDVILEAFLCMPELNLIICGPDSEKAFFDAYGKKIVDSPNIRYEGFVKIGGEKFEEICSKCSFTILYSSSEGAATSVATTMRAGLVPIINPESSINVDDFGFLMTNKEDRIEDILVTVRKASTMTDKEYVQRVYSTLLASLKYTQSAFTISFTKALLSVMQNEPRFHPEGM